MIFPFQPNRTVISVDRSTYRLTIPSSTRYLETVRSFVEKYTAKAGFDRQSVEQFKVAVDEACTNVIKHAYRGNEACELDVSVTIYTDRCTVCIRDEGRTFRPQDYREPDIFELAKRRQAGGFGVHIMRRLMDHVEYSNEGSVNEVRLTKYLGKHRQNGSH